MEEMNETTHEIKYISATSFSIDSDTTNSSTYAHGGIIKRVKQPTQVTFTSLAKQLQAPDVVINDLSKLDAPLMSLVALTTMNKNKDCLDTLSSNEKEFLSKCVKTNFQLTSPVEILDNGFLKHLARTCKGMLAPLCAVVGGMAAQEVIKGLSGKFSPLKQWLLIDAIEVCGEDFHGPSNSENMNPRYTQLLHCIPEDVFQKLTNCRLFMVGCGAIGCEMLKNYALLGISTDKSGLITITDNDLIEKSNLNRQFLFRPWHIQVHFDILMISGFLIGNITHFRELAFEI